MTGHRLSDISESDPDLLIQEVQEVLGCKDPHDMTWRVGRGGDEDSGPTGHRSGTEVVQKLEVVQYEATMLGIWKWTRRPKKRSTPSIKRSERSERSGSRDDRVSPAPLWCLLKPVKEQ